MSLFCDCPNPTALEDISTFNCGENFGQIQKMVFQRAGYTFSGVDTIDLEASWTTLLSATDDTKVVVTPKIPAITIPMNDAITFGGDDNTTIDGAVRVDGVGSVRVSGMLTSVPNSVIQEIRKVLQCETDLVVYFFNQFDRVIAKDVSVAQDGSELTGFPISTQSGFVGDAGNEGLNTRDTANLSFSMPAGWRDGATITAPEAGFSYLNDVVPS